jgi:predicted phosphohydrolase
LYAIGDLHLALGAPDKSMETFGGRWQDYTAKLEKGFALLTTTGHCA